MEQQTISIAKAGITTMLRSRTSVLAAANPPSGRYDDLKTAQENIDLQSTILSRFDLIFIVKVGGRVHSRAVLAFSRPGSRRLLLQLCLPCKLRAPWLNVDFRAVTPKH